MYTLFTKAGRSYCAYLVKANTALDAINAFKKSINNSLSENPVHIYRMNPGAVEITLPLDVIFLGIVSPASDLGQDILQDNERVIDNLIGDIAGAGE